MAGFSNLFNYLLSQLDHLSVIKEKQKISIMHLDLFVNLSRKSAMSECKKTQKYTTKIIFKPYLNGFFLVLRFCVGFQALVEQFHGHWHWPNAVIVIVIQQVVDLVIVYCPQPTLRELRHAVGITYIT